MNRWVDDMQELSALKCITIIFSMHLLMYRIPIFPLSNNFPRRSKKWQSQPSTAGQVKGERLGWGPPHTTTQQSTGVRKSRIGEREWETSHSRQQSDDTTNRIWSGPFNQAIAWFNVWNEITIVIINQLFDDTATVLISACILFVCFELRIVIYMSHRDFGVL